MFKIVKNISTDTIKKLLEIYKESMNDIFEECYRNRYELEKDAKKVLIDDYTQFIQEFAKENDRLICVIEEDNTYISALRVIKTKENEWFIEALETHPHYRNRGLAKRLILNVVEYLNNTQSHIISCNIANNNFISQSVHEACGFKKTVKSAINFDGNLEERCIRYEYTFKTEQ